MTDKIETTEEAVVALLKPLRFPMLRAVVVDELIVLGQHFRHEWPPSKDVAEVIRAMIRDGKLKETDEGLSLVRNVAPAERMLF